MSGKRIKQIKRQLKKGQMIFANEFIKEIESRKLKERILIAYKVLFIGSLRTLLKAIAAKEEKKKIFLDINEY